MKALMSFLSRMIRPLSADAANRLISGPRVEFVTSPQITSAEELAIFPGRLMEEAESLRATEWLRRSLVGFGRPLSAVVPGHFAAYARIYHPFNGRNEAAHDPEAHSWKAVIVEIPDDPHEAFELAIRGAPSGQAEVGGAPRYIVDILASRLAPATTTPAECFFAVWHGFGGLSPRFRLATLYLPHREYHVFAGPLANVTTGSGYSTVWFSYQSPNLWWPADRAWCVATEVDHAWTYVGASRKVVDDILADPRLEAVETNAQARW
jgi:hypothetical protein